MDEIELLTVEDSFEISGRRVIVIPDFSVPERWKDRVDSVSLVTPAGRKIATRARFNLSHFSLSVPNAPMDKRWRIVVLLLDCGKEQVTVGSKLLVPLDVYRAIMPEPER